MKKVLAIALAMLMLLPLMSVFAGAEGETYTITYIVKNANGTVASQTSQTVAAGEKPTAPANPEAYTINGVEYKFNGWISSIEEDADKRYYQGTMPAATADTTYTADFVITSTPDDTGVTLFGFLRDIFSNINRILSAAIREVESWTEHIGKGSDFVKDLFDNLF